MRDLYVTTEMVQFEVSDFYFHFGTKINFIEAVKRLYDKGLYFESRPPLPSIPVSALLSEESFIELMNKMPISIQPMINQRVNGYIEEPDILPDNQDVFVYRHLNFIDDITHSHDYFEICYIYKGFCSLKFEKEMITLREGELCIIAPTSVHEVKLDDSTSVVITISIRKSTLDTAFFSLISQRDLLSCFFRTLLHEKSSANYLLFYTNNTDDIKLILKNLFVENHADDLYANNGCISWINILFSYLLRNYSKTMSFYDYNLTSDFSLVLQYIQHNYKNLKLKDLAAFFHFNEAHLSTLITKNTGSNFTDLITNFKISDSIHYLKNTDMSVEEIAFCVGYHSADHFSRIFKKKHQHSPQQYRKLLSCQHQD